MSYTAKERRWNKTARQEFENNLKLNRERRENCFRESIDELRQKHKHFAGRESNLNTDLDWAGFLKENDKAYQTRMRKRHFCSQDDVKVNRQWRDIINSFKRATRQSNNNKYRTAVGLLWQ